MSVLLIFVRNFAYLVFNGIFRMDLDKFFFNFNLSKLSKKLAYSFKSFNDEIFMINVTNQQNRYTFTFLNSFIATSK